MIEAQRGQVGIFGAGQQRRVLARIESRVVRTGTEDLGLEFLPGQEERVESLLYESRFLDREAL